MEFSLIIRFKHSNNNDFLALWIRVHCIWMVSFFTKRIVYGKHAEDKFNRAYTSSWL